MTNNPGVTLSPHEKLILEVALRLQAEDTRNNAHGLERAGLADVAEAQYRHSGEMFALAEKLSTMSIITGELFKTEGE
jgi:hypothetical protein